MIDIEWNKGDLNNFYKKLDRICQNLVKHAETGVNKACEETQRTALEYKYGSKDPNKIRTESEQINKYEIKGRVYTDKDDFSYATFLEYGTGALKDPDLPVIAHTDTYYETGGTKWYLPVDKVEHPLENPIVYVNVRDKNGNPTGQYIACYVMMTQPAKPFMRPTAFERRNPNKETIRKEVQTGLRGDIK